MSLIISGVYVEKDSPLKDREGGGGSKVFWERDSSPKAKGFWLKKYDVSQP